MSERRVYDMLRMHYEVCHEECKCGRCTEVHKAITESRECPDVVAALRWLLSESHTWLSGRCEPHITLSWEDIEAYFADTFYVRLTDDGGWEDTNKGKK